MSRPGRMMRKFGPKPLRQCGTRAVVMEQTAQDVSPLYQQEDHEVPEEREVKPRDDHHQSRHGRCARRDRKGFTPAQRLRAASQRQAQQEAPNRMSTPKPATMFNAFCFVDGLGYESSREASVLLEMSGSWNDWVCQGRRCR